MVDADRARRARREKLQHPAGPRAEVEQSSERPVPDHGDERRLDSLLRRMQGANHVPVGGALGEKPFRSLLDLGTGTGRMLELLAPRAVRAVGVDQSAAMLALARSRVDEAGLKNVQLRQGDIYAPPVERDGYDLVVVHQVLHFLDDPGRAVKEAARALAPGGRLALVDFDAHHEEFLRTDFAHRRLGFMNSEIEGYIAEAGLTDLRAVRVPPAPGESGKLTVALWLAQDPRIVSDGFQKSDAEFA